MSTHRALLPPLPAQHGYIHGNIHMNNITDRHHINEEAMNRIIPASFPIPRPQCNTK